MTLPVSPCCPVIKVTETRTEAPVKIGFHSVSVIMDTFLIKIFIWLSISSVTMSGWTNLTHRDRDKIIYIFKHIYEYRGKRQDNLASETWFKSSFMFQHTNSKSTHLKRLIKLSIWQCCHVIKVTETRTEAPVKTGLHSVWIIMGTF